MYIKNQIIDLLKKYPSVEYYNIEVVSLRGKFYLIDLTINQPNYVMDALINGKNIKDEIEYIAGSRSQINIKWINLS
jgi:hypothetical protein